MNRLTPGVPLTHFKDGKKEKGDKLGSFLAIVEQKSQHSDWRNLIWQKKQNKASRKIKRSGCERYTEFWIAWMVKLNFHSTKFVRNGNGTTNSLRIVFGTQFTLTLSLSISNVSQSDWHNYCVATENRKKLKLFALLFMIRRTTIFPQWDVKDLLCGNTERFMFHTNFVGEIKAILYGQDKMFICLVRITQKVWHCGFILLPETWEAILFSMYGR